MNAIDLVTPRLQTEEGFRAFPYKDTVGKTTIGYGLNLDAGISKELAGVILDFGVRQLDAQLSAYAWYSALDDARKSVFLDVGFNAGIVGLLHFTQTIAAVAGQDWQTAHDQLLNSAAARMLPTRYNALAQILLTGVIT